MYSEPSNFGYDKLNGHKIVNTNKKLKNNKTQNDEKLVDSKCTTEVKIGGV